MEGKYFTLYTLSTNLRSPVSNSSRRDGHYGLWLDDSFEKGVSSPCLTFGNEPLCDEGTKFDVLNVELWYIGN